MNILATILCLLIVVVLAIYYTLFKIRQELTENQAKLESELSEVRKALEKATDKG